MINDRQLNELTGKGDCREHYHLEDRGPFPIVHGAFYDLTNQSAVSTTAGYAMLLGETLLSEGISVENGSQVTVKIPGVYNIQFSAQFANPDGADHVVRVWLAVGGTNVASSTRIINVCADRGSGGGGGGGIGYHPASWDFMQLLQRGEYFEIMWAVEDLDVSLAYVAANAGPPSVPAIPSVAVTVHLVSI